METDLSDLEKKILEIADLLTLSNKTITLETLFNGSKKNLAKSTEEISKAINFLILKKYIIFGTKVTRNQVLLNGKRYRIHLYILNNPGCSLAELKKFINLKGSLINWHLSVLEKFNFIFRRKFLKDLRFFSIDFNESLVTPWLILKEPNSFKIFEILLQYPILELQQLKTFTFLELDTIDYHLKKLIEIHIVRIEKIHDYNFYTLNPETIKSLQNYLGLKEKDIKNFLYLQNKLIDEKINTAPIAASSLLHELKEIDYKQQPSRLEVQEHGITHPEIKIIDTLSKKIFDALDIVLILENVCLICEENGSVSDILLSLQNAFKKIALTFPDLIIGEQIKDIFKKIDNNYPEASFIDVKFSNNLEFQVINWLTTIYNLTINNFKIYKEIFPEELQKVKQLNHIIIEINERNAKLDSNYANQILLFLLVIDRKSGLPLFEFNFKKATLNNPDLLSGFFSAIQSFGSEISDDKSPVTKISYKNLEIELDVRTNFICALLVNGETSDYVKYLLSNFSEAFKQKYAPLIETWTGNVSIFQEAEHLCNTIFR